MRRYRKTYKRRSRRVWRRRYARKSSDLATRWIKRSFTQNAFNGTTGVDQQISWNFQLSSLPQYTEFTNLFKEYRIARVQYRFRIYKGTEQVANSLNPVIYHAFDERGSAAVFAATDVLAYSSAKISVLTDSKPVTRWFSIRPCTADAVYQGAFTAYALSRKQFISTAYPSVQHYGLMTALTQAYTGINVAMDVKFLLAFRGVA
ncbi:MAG: capsid protein [CRESS virus sp. ctwD22]|nr:MAG: capsid protein [CRESS virus sp. ctwD22]